MGPELLYPTCRALISATMLSTTLGVSSLVCGGVRFVSMASRCPYK